MDKNAIYPRENVGDKSIVYLKNVITDPTIVVGDYTYYADMQNDPRDFEKNNVLYHYRFCVDEKLIIGKYCSIAQGAKFMFAGGNHAMKSASNFPFQVFWYDWGLEKEKIATAWDNKGDTVIGNDVWIGYHVIVMQGVHVGDGAVLATGAVVSKDVEPYTIVGGVPAKTIKKRFDDDTCARLEKIKWWDWDDEKVQRNIEHIKNGEVDALERAE